MNPQLRHAIQLASQRKWTPTAPRQTPGERTATAIARAASSPVRTAFWWNAGGHIADLTFGIVRLLLMLAILAGLAYGALKLIQREPSTKAITPKPPIAKTEKATDRKRQ